MCWVEGAGKGRGSLGLLLPNPAPRAQEALLPLSEAQTSQQPPVPEGGHARRFANHL